MFFPGWGGLTSQRTSETRPGLKMKLAGRADLGFAVPENFLWDWELVALGAGVPFISHLKFLGFHFCSPRLVYFFFYFLFFF